MAKCPDCGSNIIFHRRGSLGCIANQMPEAERKQQKELVKKGWKRIATFIGVVVFLIWLVGVGETFFLLIVFRLGYVIGTESERIQKYYHAKGFFDGWIARHQGRGIGEIVEIYSPPTGIHFALSAAERELLKDPDERSWRSLPPLEDGK